MSALPIDLEAFEAAPVAREPFAYAMVPLAVVMVLSGALRGAGDTRWPLALNLLGVVLVRVPLAIYLSHDLVPLPLVGGTIAGAGLGVVGAWYAAVLDIVARGEVDPAYLLTHKLSLDKGQEGYMMFKEKANNNMRSVFAPAG